jgi:hypothetical protein
MKGANLMVFRTQEVKLGDLGISVKLDDTKKDNYHEELYKGKEVIPGYVTDVYQDSIANDYPVSKQSLFNCDNFAL